MGVVRRDPELLSPTESVEVLLGTMSKRLSEANLKLTN